jgi:hypothetical protein
VPTFVATYLADALRVVLAALAILVIGIVLWLLLDLLREALGIETPTVGLLSTAVIALLAPMVAGYASARFITPISLTHAALAGAIVSALYVFIFTTGPWATGCGLVAAASIAAAIGAADGRPRAPPPNNRWRGP